MSSEGHSITINDRPRKVGSHESLESVMAEAGFAGKKGIAVAINGEVVGRGEWGARPLAAGDHILVIQATQGG